MSLRLGAGSTLRIIVLGYIVRGPLGGLAWHHLQYVIGLTRLGHDVYFLEDSDDYPACYDPVRGVVDTDPTYGLRFASDTFARVGLDDRWAYHDAHTSRWFGPCAAGALDICASADLLLNLSGTNPLRPWLEEVPARAFVDTDPAFTQIRHLTDPAACSLVTGHTSFFSFGENFGREGCTIPDDGFSWRPTRQPIVLDAWPVTPGPARGKFRTVMQWDSYVEREYRGRRYGMKSASFGPYLDLPRTAEARFELALGTASAPRSLLGSRGWSIVDPLLPTRDPWTYQRYIEGSKAEFSIAKEGYVVSRSGWFSERSAAFLASGRPVLVQETGFSEWMRTGEGVVAFDNLDQAVGGVKEINSRYELHCRAARALAEEYFDAREVLPHMLEGAMRPVPRAGTALTKEF